MSLAFLIWTQISWCGTTDDYLHTVYPDSFLRHLLSEAAVSLVESSPYRENVLECPSSKYIIPVVFHIVYSSSRDSIGYERIWNQMLRVFEDFRRVPETNGYASAGADMEIEFSLATIDPNGDSTRGVVYWRYDQPPLNWSSPNFCRETQDLAMKEATAWDQNRYLNVWIVPRLCVEGPDGSCNQCGAVAGYAFFPFLGPYQTRYGVVIGANYFWGSLSPRSGRTLVHELGHNLNLYHPFQSGCGTVSCSLSGDRVCDTPPTAVESGNFSVQRQNTCRNDSPDRPDNMRNFMDYVSDVDMTHFTLGQKVRAYDAIRSSISILSSLTQSSVPELTGTGPYGHVKAYFSASSRVGCVGEPIQFFSYSMGMPHIYRWNFSGGIADDSTSSCPKVVFPAPGVYDVELIVENLSGRRDTLRKTEYIRIQERVYDLPYIESFEGNTFPPTDSYLFNPDRSRTWDRMRSSSPPRGAYGRSSTSARLLFFLYDRYGERDGWITPLIDLRPYEGHNRSIQLSFSWAYACLNYEGQVGEYPSYELDYADTLQVYVSTDCGASWTLIWQKAGRELATYPDGCITVRGSIGLNQFLPTADVWATDSLILDEYKGKIIRLQFEGISGWGNNLFLDDIRIDTVPFREPSSLSSPSLPFRAYVHEGILHLEVQELLPGMEVILYDVQGRMIWRESWSATERGMYRVSLPPTLARGLYFLRVQSGSQYRALRYWHS
ncbi:MAG: M43 family zinc metalloprotease [Bacteroidia bacterium]|nr:M43 family zinc metalloprotease [Bacteroidia bacterium]MDW8016023.1 M43 family zinc metalloprotease [Bacteroidia bacterium]